MSRILGLIKYNNIVFNLPNFKYDSVGALASGLCILHCLATPFFFIASACSLSCCSNTPLWWQMMDYLFLGISFFAIKYATKSSSEDWVVQGLWVSWSVLFLFIVNLKFEWIHLAENLTDQMLIY